MKAMLLAACGRLLIRVKAGRLGVVGFTLALVAAAPVLGQLPDFTSLAREQGAAVVNISAVYRVPWEAPQPALPQPEDEAALREFLKRFFGPEGARQFEGVSLGSGFIVSDDGYIITNAHLVADPDPHDIIVRLADRKEFEARVVGFDAESDIALLKIDATGLHRVRFGDANALQVGEWVAAIGSPLGFESSLTAGIVSAKGRALPESYIPLIQTDVAVNPGNSGGPLFNVRGEVVGVNSLIYSDNGGFMGVSFAIPIDIAVEVAGQLAARGKVRRGAMGVRVQEVSADLAKALRLPRPAGALVSDVQKDGPQNLRPGDVIVRIGDKPVERAGDLLWLTARSVPGSMVPVELIREGALLSLRVLIASRTEPMPRGAKASRETHSDWLGVQLAELVAADRDRLGAQHGLMVQRAEGAALRAGLRRGDVILSMDGHELASVAEFHARIAQAGAGATVALRVQRGGTRLFVPLRIPG
jgi:serine protease Do